MYLLQVLNARQCCESDDKHNKTDEEARQRPCHTDIKRHLPAWQLRADTDDGTERAEVDHVAEKRPGKWDVVRKCRIDFMVARSKVVTEFMRREKEQQQQRILQPITEILQLEGILANPCNAGNRRRK